LRTSSHTTWHSSQAGEVAEGSGGKPVFYLIVMGKLAYRHQVSLWLTSLRKLGGFKDEVVLITDKPVCLAKTLEEAKLLGPKISSNENVEIYGPGAGFEGNLHFIKRPVVKDIYKMKMEKTRGWLNVKNAAIPHPVSSIIYTDEDVVIGKDLTNFVQMVRQTEKLKHTLGLFRDTGASAGELHTGVVVMFPGENTELCMQSWAKHLAKNGRQQKAEGKKHAFKEISEDDLKEDQLTEEEMEVYGPDQRALGSTSLCKKKDTHDGIKIFPAEYFMFPTKGSLKSDKKAEFVHFTNTGRMKIISHDLIKEYLIRLGIPAEIDPLGNVKDKTCATDGTLTAKLQ